MSKKIKLRKLKARDKKKVLKLVKKIRDVNPEALDKALTKITQPVDLALTEEEIKKYTSLVPETSRKEFDELKKENQIEVLKQMKQEKEKWRDIIDIVIDLIEVYETVADSIDELLAELGNVTVEDIEELDLDVYYDLLKGFVANANFGKLFHIA